MRRRTAEHAILALLLASLPACSNGCGLRRRMWSGVELPKHAEHIVAHTRDGWDLSIIHYAPAKPLPGRRPVLMVHGIVTNERNLDYDEKHSIARNLSLRGLDVWALSLRGTGESARASLFGGEHKYDWDFDTYCEEDLPAAIALVLKKTHAAQLDYIGHSMGGMLYYCLLARGGPSAQAIGAGATLGSPVGFRWGPRFTQLAQAAALVGSKLPAIKLDSATLLTLPLASWYPEPMALLLYNPANMSPDVWSGFLSVGVEDESPLLAGQFHRWIETDRFTSRDGALDYEQLLATVRTPTLVVAGKADQLGFPPLVRRGFDALGASPLDKSYLLVGVENGARADYGHMDLLLGEGSDRDVFEPVASYLAAHAGTGHFPK